VEDESEKIGWPFAALSMAFGLKPQQQRLIVRIGWVSLVSVHIAWVCGWLAAIGLHAPFAYAGDVEKLQRTVNLSAQLNLAQEIRSQTVAKCRSQDQQVKEALARYIETLQQEYAALTNTRYPEPPCQP